MNKTQKIKEVIKFAIKNGWKTPKDFDVEEIKDFENEDRYVVNLFIRGLLFSHEFAKAFWKSKDVYEQHDQQETGLDWKHHLQQAVVSKNCLDYYYVFLRTK